MKEDPGPKDPSSEGVSTRLTILSAAGTPKDGILERLSEFAGPRTVQIMDSGAISGRRHVISGVEHAFRACEQGRMTSRTLGGEILLYLTGVRQISKALELGGIGPRTTGIVVIGIDLEEKGLKAFIDSEGFQLEDGALDVPLEDEMEALERVAFLDLDK